MIDRELERNPAWDNIRGGNFPLIRILKNIEDFVKDSPVYLKDIFEPEQKYLNYLNKFQATNVDPDRSECFSGVYNLFKQYQSDIKRKIDESNCAKTLETVKTILKNIKENKMTLDEARTLENSLKDSSSFSNVSSHYDIYIIDSVDVRRSLGSLKGKICEFFVNLDKILAGNDKKTITKALDKKSKTEAEKIKKEIETILIKVKHISELLFSLSSYFAGYELN